MEEEEKKQKGHTWQAEGRPGARAVSNCTFGQQLGHLQVGCEVYIRAGNDVQGDRGHP
jgi:hypothetical protein